MEAEPFILFGDQHVLSLIYSGVIIIFLCLLGNFINTKSQDMAAKVIGVSLLVFERLRYSDVTLSANNFTLVSLSSKSSPSNFKLGSKDTTSAFSKPILL